MLILSVLFWCLVVLLAAFVLFLVAPLRVRLAVSNAPRFRYTVTARPFSQAFPAVTVADSDRPSKPKKEKAPRQKKRAGRKGKSGRDWINPRAFLTLPRTLARMLGAIEVEQLRVDAEFGLGDPAETGRLYGQLTPVIYGTHQTRAQIEVRPNFETACLVGTCEAQFRLTPVWFLAPAAGFLWRLLGPGR